MNVLISRLVQVFQSQVFPMIKEAVTTGEARRETAGYEIVIRRKP